MVWLTIYSNTVVYGENLYGESGHLSIFTILKHLMMLLKYIFFRVSFYIACRAMQLRFFLNENIVEQNPEIPMSPCGPTSDHVGLAGKMTKTVT